jgi:uncharacterized protein involved in outer membrane biogenesis
MRTSKKVGLFLGIIVIVAAVAIFFLISNLDAIVKRSIEKYGSQATGTGVKVSSVKIGLKEGKGSISGLSVGNPKGFAAPNVFDMKNITVKIDAASVRKDPVVIDNVQISTPHVVYEINEKGKSNIDQLKKNLGIDRKGAGSSEKEKAPGEKKILIRNFVIEGGKVEIRVAARSDKSFSATLPTIRLTNLGGKGGATPGEIARQIIGPLTSRVVDAAARAGIEQYLGKSTEEVQKMLDAGRGKLGTVGEGAAKEAEGALKKLLGK